MPARSTIRPPAALSVPYVVYLISRRQSACGHWLPAPLLIHDRRRGRTRNSERIVGANFHKASSAMLYLSLWAGQRGLVVRDDLRAMDPFQGPLRICKTGDLTIDRAYRTYPTLQRCHLDPHPVVVFPIAPRWISGGRYS